MGKTVLLRAEAAGDIALAASILRGGGLVAFPTETVYGLGANALDPVAIAGIFVAKGRPAWDPLIVHVPDFCSVDQVATIPNEAAQRVEALAKAFWPGPLTLLLPRRSAIPEAVTAGRARVGVRVPAHPAAQALLRAVKLPLAAPSANRFGHTSPTTARHVLDDLDGRVGAVLDGGACGVGVESTVLDPVQTPMVVYRAGAVTRQMLERVAGVDVEVFVPPPLQTEPEALPSPGVGIRHYAPTIPFVLSAGDADDLRRVVGQLMGSGERVGVLLPQEWSLDIAGEVVVVPWGRWGNPETLARELFAAMRMAESSGMTVVACPLPAPGGMRDALRDRLLKAARTQ